MKWCKWLGHKWSLHGQPQRVDHQWFILFRCIRCRNLTHEEATYKDSVLGGLIEYAPPSPRKKVGEYSASSSSK